MDPTTQKNRDTDVPLKEQIHDLYELVDNMKTGLLCTRRSDGFLVSRAMSVASRAKGIDFWLFTNNQSHKLEELAHDPHVNLAFFRDSTQEWVSISGKARVVDDRNRIRELYTPTLRAWLGDLGDGTHDGGKDDPRLSLIYLETHSVCYALKDKGALGRAMEMAKGVVTGNVPKMQSIRELGADEVTLARTLETEP
ncbi:uncharacterized protein VTP21DRAFT_5357 [Calcarisporiella thermophila]|uniref:uncharacterized protein n=1 Tax=Calcarisporiella thermophila TaxID=911321 RepID=UPI003744390E